MTIKLNSAYSNNTKQPIFCLIMESYFGSLSNDALHMANDITQYIIDNRLDIYDDTIHYKDIWKRFDMNARMISPYRDNGHHTTMVCGLYDIKHYNKGLSYKLDYLPSKTWKLNFKWKDARSINIYLADKNKWYTIKLDAYGCTIVFYNSKLSKQWMANCTTQESYTTKNFLDNYLDMSLDDLIEKYGVDVDETIEDYPGDSLPQPKITIKELDDELLEYMKCRC